MTLESEFMTERNSCPMTAAEIADAYFMEHRAKLIDLAAFLDRVDRASGSEDEGHEVDFRITALHECLRILTDGKNDRTRRVLEHLSDHSSEPLQTAPMKGALGAPAPE